MADVNPQCQAIPEVDIQISYLEAFNSLKGGQAAFIVGDAVSLLIKFLDIKAPDMVITAIPGHAAAKVINGWLEKRNYTLRPNNNVIPRVLDNLPRGLISFIDKVSAVIATSYMPSHMRCKENCIPPKDFCALTGRPRLAPMYKLLRFSVFDLVDKSKILISRQLGPSVGAIDGEELCALLKQLESIRKSYTLAIGTACDCHGILNLIQVKSN